MLGVAGFILTAGVCAVLLVLCRKLRNHIINIRKLEELKKKKQKPESPKFAKVDFGAALGNVE